MKFQMGNNDSEPLVQVVKEGNELVVSFFGFGSDEARSWFNSEAVMESMKVWHEIAGDFYMPLTLFNGKEKVKGNDMEDFVIEDNRVKGFVLAHCFEEPVFDEDFGGLEIIKGEGVDSDEYERLLAKSEFILWVREWCSKEKCNQVVVSKRGYPTGCAELVEMEITDSGPVGDMLRAIRNKKVAGTIQPIGIQWLEMYGHLHHTLQNGICEWMSKDWPEIPQDDYSPRGPLYGKVENLLVWAPGGAIIVNKTMTEAEAIEQAEAEWASVFDDKPEDFKWLAYTSCFDDECWFRHAKLSDADQQKYMAIAVKALKVMNHSQILQDLLTGGVEIPVEIRSTESGLTSFTHLT